MVMLREAVHSIHGPRVLVSVSGRGTEAVAGCTFYTLAEAFLLSLSEQLCC